MNAVWLSDELMVSPAAVAGLSLHWTSGGVEYFSSINSPMRWYIMVQWVGGANPTYVWGHVGFKAKSHAEADAGRDAFKAASRPEAEAEMARLSELLWPSAPYRAVDRPVTVGPDPFRRRVPSMPVAEPEPEPNPFALKHDDGVPVEFSNPAMTAASARAAEVGVLKPPFSVRREAAKVAWLALCAVVDEWVATGDRSPAGEQVPLRECRHPQWRESDGYTVECDLLVGHDGAHRFPR